MLIRRRTLLSATAAAAVASPALAQNYPRRAVQLIVAFPPGGSTDVGARILAAAAEKDLGQTITVVNKGGAGGQIGFTEVARARPDGYTLGFLNLPAVNTIILDPERKAAFNVDSFIPVINQVLDPGLIWVKGDSPYKTLADLTEAARKNPGKISACTTGILSDDHLAILMVQEAAKCEFRIVHFDGGAHERQVLVDPHVGRQAEHALGDDVAQDLVGAAGDARGRRAAAHPGTARRRRRRVHHGAGLARAGPCANARSPAAWAGDQLADRGLRAGVCPDSAVMRAVARCSAGRWCCTARSASFSRTAGLRRSPGRRRSTSKRAAQRRSSGKPGRHASPIDQALVHQRGERHLPAGAHRAQALAVGDAHVGEEHLVEVGRPLTCLIGRTSMPGLFMSMKNMVRPSCLGTSGRCG
jgi:hypothetical protein